MNNKVKLILFIYSLAGGGAERVCSYLLPYLKDKGIDVSLVLMNRTIDYELPENLPIYYLENSKADEHGIRKLLKLPFLAYKYARLLKKTQATHSLSMLTRPCYINIMARWFTRHKFKLIISERNYPSLQYGYKDLQGKVNKFMVKRLYPKADQIISNAKESAIDLAENFNCDPEKISVIYNPIDNEKIDKIPAVEEFFDPNYFNTVSIGRLQKVKNHKLLIETVHPFDKVRLYIFGDGPLRQELTDLIRTKGLENRVFMMGFESNPFQYLKKADLFIFGSNHEGFPNVLLEAMCCGLPILTTNCQSGPSEMMELSANSESDIMQTPYGILTPVGNLELLRKGLDYIMKDMVYLNNCRNNVLRRSADFERLKILELYKEEIFK